MGWLGLSSWWEAQPAASFSLGLALPGSPRKASAHRLCRVSTCLPGALGGRHRPWAWPPAPHRPPTRLPRLPLVGGQPPRCPNRASRVHTPEAWSRCPCPSPLRASLVPCVVYNQQALMLQSGQQDDREGLGGLWGAGLAPWTPCLSACLLPSPSRRPAARLRSQGQEQEQECLPKVEGGSCEGEG